METENKIQLLKVDVTKLYTQQAYATKIKMSRGRINQMVKAKEISIVSINGATLVYAD